MKDVRNVGFRTGVLLLVACAPWLMAAQCWSKIQGATIPVTISKSFDFDVDISKYTKDKLPDTKGQDTIPKDAPDTPIPIEVPQDIDISDNPDIQKYGRKVVGIDIQTMEVEVTDNTSNIPLPKVTLMMGDVKVKPSAEIGFLSSIPAGKTFKENIIKNAASRSTISGYLTKFAFSIGAKTTLVVKGGMPIPKGVLKMKIHLKVTFQIQPLKK